MQINEGLRTEGCKRRGLQRTRGHPVGGTTIFEIYERDEICTSRIMTSVGLDPLTGD